MPMLFKMWLILNVFSFDAFYWMRMSTGLVIASAVIDLLRLMETK